MFEVLMKAFLRNCPCAKYRDTGYVLLRRCANVEWTHKLGSRYTRQVTFTFWPLHHRLPLPSTEEDRHNHLTLSLWESTLGNSGYIQLAYYWLSYTGSRKMWEIQFNSSLKNDSWQSTFVVTNTRIRNAVECTPSRPHILWNSWEHSPVWYPEVDS
jgi:hypothetical protein